MPSSVTATSTSDVTKDSSSVLPTHASHSVASADEASSSAPTSIQVEQQCYVEEYLIVGCCCSREDLLSQANQAHDHNNRNCIIHHPHFQQQFCPLLVRTKQHNDRAGETSDRAFATANLVNGAPEHDDDDNGTVQICTDLILNTPSALYTIPIALPSSQGANESKQTPDNSASCMPSQWQYMYAAYEDDSRTLQCFSVINEARNKQFTVTNIHQSNNIIHASNSAKEPLFTQNHDAILVQLNQYSIASSSNSGVTSWLRNHPAPLPLPISDFPAKQPDAPAECRISAFSIYKGITFVACISVDLKSYRASSSIMMGKDSHWFIFHPNSEIEGHSNAQRHKVPTYDMFVCYDQATTLDTNSAAHQVNETICVAVDDCSFPFFADSFRINVSDDIIPTPSAGSLPSSSSGQFSVAHIKQWELPPLVNGHYTMSSIQISTISPNQTDAVYRPMHNKRQKVSAVSDDNTSAEKSEQSDSTPSAILATSTSLILVSVFTQQGGSGQMLHRIPLDENGIGIQYMDAHERRLGPHSYPGHCWEERQCAKENWLSSVSPSTTDFEIVSSLSPDWHVDKVEISGDVDNTSSGSSSLDYGRQSGEDEISQTENVTKRGLTTWHAVAVDGASKSAFYDHCNMKLNECTISNVLLAAGPRGVLSICTMPRAVQSRDPKKKYRPNQGSFEWTFEESATVLWEPPTGRSVVDIQILDQSKSIWALVRPVDDVCDWIVPKLPLTANPDSRLLEAETLPLWHVVKIHDGQAQIQIPMNASSPLSSTQLHFVGPNARIWTIPPQIEDNEDDL